MAKKSKARNVVWFEFHYNIYIYNIYIAIGPKIIA
jgi:hypothetical protein